MQFILAREIIERLEVAQECRVLSAEEVALRTRLKWRCLGLASMTRTIARQRSRLLFLDHGDANTKLFHLQACHRSRKNYIHSLTVHDHTVVTNELMADALLEHFNGFLGTPAPRSSTARLDILDLPAHDLAALDVCFTENEIWAVIRDIPAEKSPGPDGFTGLFYKNAWPIIKNDIVAAFNAFWALDGRSFHLVNDDGLVEEEDRTGGDR